MINVCNIKVKRNNKNVMRKFCIPVYKDNEIPILSKG